MMTLALPTQAAPLIGRQAELAAYSALLRQPECRLLTLTGLGGMGKTRLAVALAQAVAPDFRAGTVFVHLAAVMQPAEVIPVLAQALNVQLYESTYLLGQLLEYLHGRQMLLVLDHFEHLLASTDLLTYILEHAPQVKLLVTSRAALNLREEWVRRIGGLPLPAHHAETLEQNGAVALFMYHARRMRGDIVFADIAESVVQLCHIVEGWPLALELAADWLRTLACPMIVERAATDIDFLMTPARNGAPYQRSLRMVLAASWRALTKDEQATLLALALLRGSFDYATAAQLAGATPHRLAALVDKSLLRLTPEDRYQMPALLRLFLQSLAPSAPRLPQRVAAQLIEPLSEREQQVLALLVAGCSNPEIAAELVIGVSTVKKHINHIFRKLAVTSRVQAVRRSQELHLV